MPRQARKESGTGIYHVMLRGINRQDVFEDAEDYMRMLRCMQQMLEQYDDQGNRLPPVCTFYAYCLMSNHVHLLLRVNQEDIGSTIKHRRLSDATRQCSNKLDIALAAPSVLWGTPQCAWRGADVLKKNNYTYRLQIY